MNLLKLAKTPPKPEIDEEQEYAQRLEQLQQLNISTFEFFMKNFKQRHILLNPIYNPSVFHPRYKKLSLWLSQLSSMNLVLAVLLTNDASMMIVNFTFKLG
jgi:hypothetical protein